MSLKCCSVSILKILIENIVKISILFIYDLVLINVFLEDFQHLSTNFLIYTAHMTIKYPSVVVFLHKTYNVILYKSRPISKHITYERMRSRQKHWTRRFLLKMKHTEMRRRRWHVWEGNRPLNANILSPGRLYLFLENLYPICSTLVFLAFVEAMICLSFKKDNYQWCQFQKYKAAIICICVYTACLEIKHT